MAIEATTKQVYASGVKPIWCPGCLLGETLVISNPSAKQIMDVEVGEKILTADGTYKTVAAKIEHRHEGLMYNIRVKSFGSLSATPEHPFVGVKRIKKKHHNQVFSEQKIEASQLSKGDYLVFPIMKEIRDIETFSLTYAKKEKDTRSKPLPNETRLDENFLRLAGYYIAEGSTHSREIIFSFNKNENEFIDDVKKLMKKIFGLEGRLRSKNSKIQGVDVIFNSSCLSEIFKGLFGDSAETKHMPHEFMFLPYGKQAWLLRGLWRGDGCFMEKKAEYTTISVVLAEQMKLLLLRYEIVPIIRAEEAHGTHKKAYRLYVSDCNDYNKLANIVGMPCHRTSKEVSCSSIIKNGRVYLPISKIETFPYEGPVYDLTMDSSDHTFVTNVTASGNCGDFGVYAAITKALTDLKVDKSNAVIVSGIGCSSAMPQTFSTYGMHSLHGRLVPVASGVKLANHELTVIGTGGDGDGYGIGVGHLIHAARRNINLTYIVMDNETYGLTTGQTSPTAMMGHKTKSTPFGVIEMPINPLALAISAGATYVARGFSGDPIQLAELIKNGIQHRGFSLIDVFSPCVTFNHDNTFEWFRPRIYKLDQSNHDPSNMMLALAKAVEDQQSNWTKIPIGVFYKLEKPTYEDLDITLQKGPLIKQPDPTKEQVQKILDEYK